jgi:hypothetical protein
VLCALGSDDNNISVPYIISGTKVPKF